MAGKKIIKKRIKRRPGKKSNLYFTKDTQAAIVRYQGTECHKEREQIYVKDIQPAMDTLVENLIFVYGFRSPYESFEDMKTDCVSFLYESLYKWSPEKGTKAFSYYNVVAKNWLILRSRKHTKQQRRHISMDSPDLLSRDQITTIENYKVAPAPDDLLINRELRNDIMNLLNEIEKRLKSEVELSCIQAIKTVFDRVDELDFLNKRAILVYVREISGLSPKRLSEAMASIRGHYRKLTNGEDRLNLFF